jgi:hypothetical protein
LKGARVDEHGIRCGGGGGTYRAVLVPSCERIPVETMGKLLELARSGGTVIFERGLPKDVPGWGNLENRRRKLRELVDGIGFGAGAGPRQGSVGKGRVVIGDLESSMEVAGARPTISSGAGDLKCITRRTGGQRYYFVVNRGGQKVEQWLRLGQPAASVDLLDPLTGKSGAGAVDKEPDSNLPRVYVQLEAGQTVIIRADSEPRRGLRWSYWQTNGSRLELSGKWGIKFVAGGPELPAPFTTAQLRSWTDMDGEKPEAFAGTAQYTLKFDASAKVPERAWLDLGKVCQSARVRLNGKDLGTVFTPPFRVEAGKLKKRNNVLEIEVTNVSANRIRDLDRGGVKWKNFYDINFVNIDYKPFDASKWPLTESGLLGPVTLTGISELRPGKRSGD